MVDKKIMDRTERFYKIQAMLMARPSVTMQELRTILEVSRPTLNRDLAYMRDRLGIPFEYVPALRGYAMTRQPSETRSFELPGVWFNQQELYSLLAMIELISKLEPGGLLLSYVSPFKSRLEALLDDGTGDAKAVKSRIKIVPIAHRQVSSEYFQVIARALMQYKRLGIAHFARQTGRSTERLVSPQRLVYYRDNWYLDAYCHLRKSLRSFSLDSITSLHLMDQPAQVVSDSDLHEIFESSYGIFTGKNQHVAKLKFTAFRAQWVSRELWHPEQVGRVHADGSYTLELPYKEDCELIQDILAQGADVQVLSPINLKKKVSETIKKMMSLYL
jgi:predicted DNA-binding transcriptional regulator YafY